MESKRFDLTSDDAYEWLAPLFDYAQAGRCVSSVTHDANNLLGAILAYTELVGLEKSLEPESQRMLGEIGSAVDRCSGLLKHLVSLGRKKGHQIALVNVTAVLQGVLDVLAYDLRISNITAAMEIEDEIPSIAADVPRLQQALTCLFLNAMEAVAELERREIAIDVTFADDTIRLRFRDSGPGVPEADQARVFEPFFTTKGKGHLGLGLPIARQTVRLHDGEVSLDPDTGFVVSLPSKNRLAQEAAKPA